MATIGAVEIYAMHGALRRPTRAATLALFPIALYQLAMTAWGIHAWILEGMASKMTFAGIEFPSWAGLAMYLVAYDVPFVIAIPWGLRRLFPRARQMGASPIIDRFELSFGIVLLSLALLVAAIFAATLRTARLAGHGSTTSQLFVGIALVTLVMLVLLALLDFRRHFLDPATRLLDEALNDTPFSPPDQFGEIWRPLAESLASSRHSLAGYVERLESQYRLNRAVQTSAIDCIVTCDAAGLVTGFNPAAESTFGWSAEEIIGRSLGDTIIPPASRAAHQRGIERAAATRHVGLAGRRVELEGLRRDGTVFPVELTLASAEIDGEIQFIAYLRDLTDRREAEAKASAAQSLLQAFFDNAPAAMYLRDPGQDRFVMMNRFATALMGLTQEQATKQPISGIPEFVDVEAMLAVHETVHRTGKPVSAEQIFALPGGDRIGLATHFPVHDESGAIDSIGGFVIDVTEARQTANELVRSREALHQSEKLGALGQLLAGVAHELNNPLAIVLGRAAMLNEALAGSPHAASIAKLRAAADRCSRIVKTFLAMARQSGPRRSLVDINELVEAAVDLTSYGLRASGIDIQLDLAPALPQTHADGDQIVQVLINLMVNAHHAMENVDRAHVLRISTALDQQKKMLCVEVADSGPGVPKRLLSRIFEPYFTTKPEGSGTGMGLTVAKGMIEAEGGSLELIASSVSGATFRMTVPVRSAEPRGAPDPVSQSEPAPARLRVLIVDDEPDLAEMLAECLVPLDAICTIAHGGAAALELAGNSRFDAVLTDVRMPGMDGLEFYDALKQVRPDSAARLAFVSGDVLQSRVSSIERTDGRPVLEKPFEPEAVRELVLRLARMDEQ